MTTSSVGIEGKISSCRENYEFKKTEPGSSLGFYGKRQKPSVTKSTKGKLRMAMTGSLG